jgi:hypothetical protein
MLYCENCGKPVNETANFCRNCGAQQKLQTQAQATSPVTSTASTPEVKPQPLSLNQEVPEQVLSFIIVNRTKRFGRQEYLTGILTSRRLIFAPMTNDMLKEVTNISRQQAKGKMPPMNAYPYQQNLLATQPSAIISQTPDSFTIENVSIREIKLSLVSVVGDGYADFEEFEMQVATDSGNQTFRMTKRGEYVTLLKQLYSEKVILPKNYIIR